MILSQNYGKYNLISEHSPGRVCAVPCVGEKCVSDQKVASITKIVTCLFINNFWPL